MKLTILLILLSCALSCGKKQTSNNSSKQPRTPSKPNYDEVELSEKYLKNFKKWEKSIYKECSISHIFNNKISKSTNYDYDQIIPEVDSFLIKFSKEKMNQRIIIHPDWKELSLVSRQDRDQRVLEKVLIQTELKDGYCHIRTNGKDIYKIRLLETIPVLYALKKEEIKILDDIGPTYQLDSFKNKDVLKDELEQIDFFKQFGRLVADEYLSPQPVQMSYCRRSRTLFTLLKDDTRERGYRCLYDFNLSIIGIDTRGDLVYQLINGEETTEINVPLEVPSSVINEEVTDFSEEFKEHQYIYANGTLIDYSFRVVNNCQLIFNLKRNYSSKIESFNILMADKRLDISLYSQRSNNRVVLTFKKKIGQNLIIKFDSSSKAKKIKNSLLEIQEKCQPTLEL